MASSNCAETADEKVILCKQCRQFLTAPKYVENYENNWPSFVWKFLTTKEVKLNHATKAWRFIPEKWRHWWIDSVKRMPQYREVTVTNPPSYFKDTTDDRKIFADGKCQGIAQLKDTLTNHLFPTVLCPWGCSTYMHKSGFIDIDVIFQRFIRDCNISTIHNKYQKFPLADSAREDFLRDKHDRLFLNDDWTILPSIAFVNNVPKVLTCDNHKKGTKDFYIHPPRSPDLIIPAEHPDQLAHAVVKPRCLRPVNVEK